MLMQGDFDLNSVLRPLEAHEEVIKETMRKQDNIFRTQVHELHRLYGVQKTLMKDLDFKGDVYRCNSWNAKAQYSLPPFTNKYEPLVKETRCPPTTKVHSTRFMGQELSEVCQGTHYGMPKRPLDLQLSADEFIKHGEGNLLKRVKFWDCLKGPVDFGCPVSFGNSSDQKELNLSLSIGEDSIRAGGTKGTWICKKIYSQTVIDLEESVDNLSEVYEKCTSLDCSAPQTSQKEKRETQVFSLSDPLILSSVNTAPSYEIAKNSIFQGYSECRQEQTSEGTRTRLDVVPCNNLSTKNQQLTCYQGGCLDLNKVCLDESSCYSNDPMLTCPSTVSISGGSVGFTGSSKDGSCPSMFCEKEVNDCSNEASGIIREDATYNGVMGSVSSLKIPLSPLGISEDIGSCSGNRKNDIVERMSNVSNGLLHDSNETSITTGSRDINCEKSEAEETVFSCLDQSQNTCQDGHGSNSPRSVKSYSIFDNDSSSVKTMHSGIKSGVINKHSGAHLGPQAADALSGEHGERTSDSSELKSECGDKKEESGEADILIQMAAESLIHISLEKTSCCEESHTKRLSEEMETEERKEIEINDKEKQQCSCDSFELFTLNLEETNVDDNSVSSSPFEVNYTETKEFSCKLRRGRRMKDFQREILPGLASLSRHEIREDINILEGVLRSREYRKMRSKMAACGQNWSVPVRSRRSRLNYVRRRIFS